MKRGLVPAAMRITLALLLGILPTLAADPLPPAQGFPDRPIRLYVYTGPGGLIDFTARKFADVSRKYVRQPIVVINKPGAGGIVCFDEVLQTPADGYTLMAVTRSNVSKLLASGRDDIFDRMDWFARVMEDPQCLIINRDTPIRDWPSLKADALAKRGRQLWLGPDIGGLDHVSALKIWRAAGIEARWIPYESGGQAIASLLGGLGATYVGNPSEARTNPSLQVAVICARQRLAQFPDVPVFREFGIEGLDDEAMWRGFAFRQGVPPHIRAWYAELFRRVHADPEWRTEWEKFGIRVALEEAEAFTATVARDRAESEYYLRQIGLLRESGTGRAGLLAGIGQAPALQFLKVSLVLVNILLGFLLLRSRLRHHFTEIMILAGVGSLALLFFLLTPQLPPPSEIDRIGAAGVPRLWIGLMIPLALLQVFFIIREKSGKKDPEDMMLMFQFMLALVLYVLAIGWLGYLLASAVFVPAAIRLLGYRHPVFTAATAVGWLAFAYFVFQRMLHVDLPAGHWFGG